LIPSDDVYESEAYFNRKYDPDKAEARERAKAREDLDAPEESPTIDRRAMLHKIIADPNESTSVRMDARRLLEIYDLRPKDFQREYDDFLTWRSETRT
jgi:hypothetical protein